jgi:23S rRNA pseudouridine2605 synthase
MKPTKEENRKKNTTSSSYSSPKERTNRTSTSKQYSSKRKSSYKKDVPDKTREKQKNRRNSFTEDKKVVSRQPFRRDKVREDGTKRRKPNVDTNERNGRKKNFQSTYSSKRLFGNNKDHKTFPVKRNFKREDREQEFSEHKSEKKRVSTVLDSEIMREIVQKRRTTGRQSHKPKVLSLAWSEDRGPIRLNKYIANSGICSRRDADILIVAGAITVNGKVVTELGTKVMPVDEIRYEDKLLQREKPVYILLNKPKGFITTTDDEKGRDNVMMLIEGACPQRVYPVGRLDRDTTGLLLFTNDGEMTKKLTHPRHGIKKIYQVELDRDMSLSDFESLANGIELSDGLMKPDDVAFVNGEKNILGIVLHSGKNRVVRRLFAHLGYEIEKLDRVYYAGLTKKNLPRGEWRFLRQEEINILKMTL